MLNYVLVSLPQFYLITSVAICAEEATGFLLWPRTPAGTTRSLPCPNTTFIVERTCNPPGIWDDVDMFIPFNTISTVSTIGEAYG